MLMYLNAWSPLRGTVWDEVVDVALLEGVL